ncbi:hypothetical protein CBU02nite_06200 [Clostridium butyricum]|uniref:Uncharacterized protein n=1 Tax=Clostridium butyricum TaxID=1492 RepID=A0A512TIN3_CLOBU|nr:hypothetical protein [Clostridium butyricum]NOW23158.1 hypothetical protein [Clostridium butyricum]GEQ20114.1 hypothetical protein CBU02nite_06200 [Clostridium butyricum]
MSGGQNTRINNEIKNIDNKIQDFNLQLRTPIKFLDIDEYGNIISNFVASFLSSTREVQKFPVASYAKLK